MAGALAIAVHIEIARQMRGCFVSSVARGKRQPLRPCRKSRKPASGASLATL